MKTGTNELIIEALGRHQQRNVDLAAKYAAEGRNPLTVMMDGDISDAVEEGRQFGIDTTDQEFLRALNEYARTAMSIISVGERMGMGPRDAIIQATMATMFLTGVKVGIEAVTMED